MKLSEELKWRGFVNQTTLPDLKKLDQNKLTFYCGFDASADSQTVGNLAVMMFAKVFMRHGYQAVLLAGGATSMIGDPGGKDVERPIQDEKTVLHNVSQAEKQLKKVFSGQNFKLVNNLDWYKNMNLLEFLRDTGKHFSMTPLVQRDYIARRIGKEGAGISYTEFSYTLLQGYDYLHLCQQYNVGLQIAGSDQWGNCLSGVELIRKVTGNEVHAITMPLIIDKKTGKKFGKSEAGAVWLDAKKTSVNDFYQFWVNTDDNGVEDYLKIYTELEKEDISNVMTAFNKDKKQRHAQKVLAYEVTKLVHGKVAAEEAQKTAEKLSKGQGAASKTANVAGKSIVEALVASGLASSKTEARKLLAAGGVYVNGVQTTKEHFEPSDAEGGLVKLRRGKTLKNTVIIRLK
jgi:tyrosyl-tRNA synthetase